MENKEKSSNVSPTSSSPKSTETRKTSSLMSKVCYESGY